MDIKGLVLSGVGVVVGAVMLLIADNVLGNDVSYNQSLTQTVVQYVPTLFAVGILIGSIAWAIKSFNR